MAKEQDDILNEVTEGEYKYGFVSDVETEMIGKGLNGSGGLRDSFSIFHPYSSIYFVPDIANIRENHYICVIYIIIIYADTDLQIQGI